VVDPRGTQVLPPDFAETGAIGLGSPSHAAAAPWHLGWTLWPPQVIRQDEAGFVLDVQLPSEDEHAPRPEHGMARRRSI